MNIAKLKEEIKNVNEPRRTAYGNIRHKLEDIIIIGLCTIISGGEDFSDMEAFGKEREDLLKNFSSFLTVYLIAILSGVYLNVLTLMNFHYV